MSITIFITFVAASNTKLIFVYVLLVFIYLACSYVVLRLGSEINPTRRSRHRQHDGPD